MAFIFLGGEHSEQNTTTLKSGGGGDVAHATANARGRLFISTRNNMKQKKRNIETTNARKVDGIYNLNLLNV